MCEGPIISTARRDRDVPTASCHHLSVLYQPWPAGFPAGAALSLIGLILIGLGCAPIYPCIIHSTPAHFGEDKSQAVIGVQMAFAYTGILGMPPLFGVIANAINVSLLPAFLFVLLALMVVMHEMLNRVAARHSDT